MKNLKWLSISFFLFIFVSCSSDNTDIKEIVSNEFTISTPSVTDVTYESATFSASITGNPVVLKKGFCYGVNPSVTINNTLLEINNAGMTLNAFARNLTPATQYYLKSYLMLSSGETFYSEETTFTTTTKSASDELASYTPPTYSDDYTSIAGWDRRNQWNLANVHDPSVMLAADGYFYMYQTDASYGNAHDGHGHFHGRRSKDLVNWEYMGATMPQIPTWIKEQLNAYRSACGLSAISNPSYGCWAPVVRKVNNSLYRMYYSVVVTDQISGPSSWSERAFIGLAETTDPASNVWEDKGFVICSASDKNLDWANNGWETAYFKWNAIDPTYIITPSQEHWLIYGSWHSGIVAVELDGTTGKTKTELPNPWGTITDIAPYGKLIASRVMTSRWQGSEGPEIIYNAETGYYYLFMAYDGLDVPYNTRVCRSRNIDGPYLGIDGRDLTASGGDMYPIVTHPYKFNNSNGWVGIAHCAVFDDGEGNWYYSSQGRLPYDVPGINASNAVMMGHVRSIRWTTDGWPVVMPERYGAVPTIAITEDELLGTWECIDLSYSYGKQKTSESLTLGAGNKVTSGMWNGSTWSYNSDKQTLTINGVELCIQREVDWELSPRTHTIVFAGYSGKKTYWGKKNK